MKSVALKYFIHKIINIKVTIRSNYNKRKLQLIILRDVNKIAWREQMKKNYKNRMKKVFKLCVKIIVEWIEKIKTFDVIQFIEQMNVSTSSSHRRRTRITQREKQIQHKMNINKEIDDNFFKLI